MKEEKVQKAKTENSNHKYLLHMKTDGTRSEDDKKNPQQFQTHMHHNVVGIQITTGHFTNCEQHRKWIDTNIEQLLKQQSSTLATILPQVCLLFLFTLDYTCKS